MNAPKFKPVTGESKKRFKGSLAHSLFKRMGLKKPDWDTVVFYLLLVCIVLLTAKVAFGA